MSNLENSIALDLRDPDKFNNKTNILEEKNCLDYIVISQHIIL